MPYRRQMEKRVGDKHLTRPAIAWPPLPRWGVRQNLAPWRGRRGCPFRLAIPGAHGGGGGRLAVGHTQERYDETCSVPIWGLMGPAGGEENSWPRGEPTHLRRQRARYTQQEARSYAANRRYR